MNPYKIEPVKTAIVGCGAISDIYFQNFTKRFRSIELVKCCSRGRKSAEAKAQQYGVSACTLEEVLADPAIEMVVNLTPAPQHEAIIRAALEAGKHVYTEKVIAPDFRTAQALLDLAKSKGLSLCCEPDHFLGSAWQCAREYIDGGLLGEVSSISATNSSNMGGTAEHLRFVNEPAGGTGFDFGIYLMTQMVCILGPVERVCGVMQTRSPERIHRDVCHGQFGEAYRFANEDMVAASLLFKNGSAAVIHMNGNSIMEAPPQFLIYGSNGVLSMPNPATFSGEMKLYRQGSFEPLPVVSAHGFDHDSRGVGAAEMAWSVRLGRKPKASAELGIHCLEALQGIRESGETGKWYEMTTTCDCPAPLPKGYRGLPGFSFDEEGSLVFAD
ncbi:MAG: Gfo/Idh/MocA family oxidoreductase [Oscillibacter sp.]|nr:Gfo/Idh/MocA family oxidoreductase [Oscillibacter sp.]